jgi:dihydrofolate reductase
MRKVIYGFSVSLDGFIEDREGKIDWVIVDEELHRHFNDQDRAIGAHLYGRRMYELMQSYWPTADQDLSNPDYIVEYALIWQNMPKIVFSRTLEQVEGNARLVQGDLAAEVARLKALPGKDMAVGGAGLAAAFMQLDLIDEYRLYVQPVVLGGGKPMFPGMNNLINLRLLETRSFGSGVVFLRYQSTVAG